MSSHTAERTPTKGNTMYHLLIVDERGPILSRLFDAEAEAVAFAEGYLAQIFRGVEPRYFHEWFVSGQTAIETWRSGEGSEVFVTKVQQ
ncbi:MAG: hypothetical protein ACRCYU_12100 [Nocardioides sp.]